MSVDGQMVGLASEQKNNIFFLEIQRLFIRYDRSSFGGRQVDRFLRQMHFTLHEVSELDELDAIVKLVANGVGAALVPQTAAHRRWPAAVRAVDLGQHTFHRDIGLVHRAKQNLSEPVRILAQPIGQLAQKQPAH
ncbi:LysR substrate binding domain protein [compost metagenome]